MSLSSTVLSELRKYALVPVFAGERGVADGESILISHVKLDECIGMYEKIHTFVHGAWKNLAGPPDCEKAFVALWIIAAENYDINRFSVSWKGMNENTLVHMWSTMDRLRTIIEPTTSSWLLGARGPVEYAKRMGMGGAADTYLYPKEPTLLPHVEILCVNMSRCTATDQVSTHVSLYDFRRSMMMRKTVPTIDVSAMILRNNTIAMEMANTPADDE